MRITAARLFPLMLMLALALLTFWLEHAVRDEQLAPSERRHDPDYIAENFRIVSYDRAGAPESSLSARKMLHYPDDDSTELSMPHLVETKAGKPRTDVSALRGSLSQDGDEVFLYDDVVLKREAMEARPALRVETSVLHYLRSRSLARSDSEVTMFEERQTISGRGMEFDLDADQLALRARVRGRIEPKKSEP